jgi:hypothetical protein
MRRGLDFRPPLRRRNPASRGTLWPHLLAPAVETLIAKRGVSIALHAIAGYFPGLPGFEG